MSVEKYPNLTTVMHGAISANSAGKRKHAAEWTNGERMGSENLDSLFAKAETDLITKYGSHPIYVGKTKIYSEEHIALFKLGQMLEDGLEEGDKELEVSDSVIQAVGTMY